jgi:hypothetical protein
LEEDLKNEKKTGFDDGAYVVVRTNSAGVFAGNLESREGSEAVLVNVRRLWYWDGAASLSQIALLGVSKPKSCKFSVAAPRELLLNVIEILETTPEAESNLKAVPEWRV